MFDVSCHWLFKLNIANIFYWPSLLICYNVKTVSSRSDEELSLETSANSLIFGSSLSFYFRLISICPCYELSHIRSGIAIIIVGATHYNSITESSSETYENYSLENTKTRLCVNVRCYLRKLTSLCHPISLPSTNPVSISKARLCVSQCPSDVSCYWPPKSVVNSLLQ